ncbi:MAG: hypothetical protein QF568_05040 [Flavobacteriales bacterium]|jgi:hypothetical protein|nr:hypothetical protein [Flavobacteriales bacterium]|tara:strand:+ start:172 stop:504 length:333 start_codon:yes stop_codon:yes gene_type:complete
MEKIFQEFNPTSGLEGITQSDLITRVNELLGGLNERGYDVLVQINISNGMPELKGGCDDLELIKSCRGIPPTIMVGGDKEKQLGLKKDVLNLAQQHGLSYNSGKCYTQTK